MKRFTEVLLLVAYISPLLSFANGLQAVRAAVKHDTVRNGAIRGLLDTRQILTCPAQTFDCGPTRCCPVGWSCCNNSGSCCQPQTYCVLASNGVIACCPNGEICSGPAGDPTSIHQDPPPPTTTIFSTSTSTRSITTAFTSTSTSTSVSTSTSTTTFTTLVGAPTQSAGATIVEVSVVDITFSENWVQGTSSCGPSITSKSTSTERSSFTYLFQYSASHTLGFDYYFNVVNYNTMWEVFINGVSDQNYVSSTTTNCTYFRSHFEPPSDTSASQNLTVVVHGMDTAVSSVSNAWSFEFNKLIIQEPTTSSTSTTLGGLGSLTQTAGTQTAGPSSGLSPNSSGRAQPYRPLLVFAGILLALLCCA